MTEIHHGTHAVVSGMSHLDHIDADICKATYSLSDPHFASSEHAFQDYLQHHSHAPELDHMDVLHSSKDSIFLQNQEHPEQCTMGIRGTQLHHSTGTLVRDVVNDAQIGLGETPHREGTAYHDFYQMRHEHPECTDWHFTGHSLGGRIANDLAAHEPHTTSTSFEAPGEPNDQYSNIRSHKILADPIAFGAPTTADIYHENPVNDFSPHSIFNY